MMKLVLALAITAGTVVAANRLESARGNLPRPPAQVPMATQQFDMAFDSKSCVGCHSTELPPYTAQRSYELIPKDPYVTWSGPDPHSRAFTRITPLPENTIAARMRETFGPQMHERHDCLVCHAVDHDPTKPLAEKKFAWSSGVGCEACHGVAANWFATHHLPPWRKKAPSGPDSKETAGLIDLRDPVTRSAKCASCHVGNAAEGKIVTHEMYAAGHPPLMPFEAATFYRDQPAHGLLPENTPYFQKPDAGVDVEKNFHYRPNEVSAARHIATGALVNLRESARLIADEAKKPGALDFAHFNCYACHHELTLPSARQDRGYPGVAGRPRIRPLPTELVEAVLTHAESQGQAANRVGQLHAKIKALNDAVTDQPFGDAPKVAAAADDLRMWADDCLKEIDAVKYTPEAVAALARQIAAKPAHPWDYDAAQLMTWAGRALKADLPSYLDQMVLPGAGLPPDQKSSAIFDHRLRVRYGFDPGEFHKAWTARAK